MKSFTPTFFSLFASTLAHFTLDYPPTRGFDEDSEPIGPCGSFNSPTGNITKFPISGAPIAIESHHPQYDIYYSFIYGNGSNQTNSTIAAIHGTGLGKVCLPNVTAPSNVQSGQIAVLQVIFNGPDGSQYQCANVNFTSDASSTNISSSICSNNTGVTAVAISGTGTTTTTALTSANSNSSGSSSSSTHSGASPITGISTFFVTGASVILAAFL